MHVTVSMTAHQLKVKQMPCNCVSILFRMIILQQNSITVGLLHFHFLVTEHEQLQAAIAKVILEQVGTMGAGSTGWMPIQRQNCNAQAAQQQQLLE